VKPVTTLLSAAVLSSVIATGAFGQSADVGRALVDSNALKLSADTPRSGPSTPAKEFIVPYAGVVRVSWQFRSDSINHTTTSFAGSAIDRCDFSTTATTFQARTCDLRVAAGDKVTVQATGELNPMTFTFSTAFVRQARVFYNVVNASGLGKVLSN
jgi:hypothetical protein